MKILAIETSCDETAVSIIEAEGNSERARFRVLGDALYSQAEEHAVYGGVYPNLAKREHQTNLVPLMIEALKAAGLFKTEATRQRVSPAATTNIKDKEFEKDIRAFLEHTEKLDIDLIAVTKGPGLEPALWTGISFAESLGIAWHIPVYGMNHMEGHIVSALLNKGAGGRAQGAGGESLSVTYDLVPVTFPILSLLISGGHTELILMNDWFRYEFIGGTRDDAVGEAFDKVARILGMPYPGGPEIAAAAARGRGRTRTIGDTGFPIRLPRPMLKNLSCDFSFSGLKTAVLYLVRDIGEMKDEYKEAIAAEFEDAVTEVLIEKTRRSLSATNAHTLAVGGGVAANVHIREGFEKLIRETFPSVTLAYPERSLTGDNAVMIGIAAALRSMRGALPETETLVAHGSQALSHPR